MNETHTHTFHLLQRFLIVVTHDVDNVFETLQAIFGVAMKLNLMDVNVLINDKDSEMWTLNFYRPYVRNCYTFDIIKIQTFTLDNYTNEINVSSENLFASRIFTFPNCSLFVSTFSLEPFVIIRNDSNGSATFDGIDVIIVNQIAKTLNLRPTYLQPPDGKNRGTIFRNGTTTGAIKLVK